MALTYPGINALEGAIKTAKEIDLEEA